MLYSKKIKLDKERTIKIGMRETLILLDKGISIFEDFDPKKLFEILLVGLQREDKKLTMDKLIDIFDECELPFMALRQIVNEAVILGLSKEDVKLTDEEEDTNKDTNNKDSKN